MPTPLRVAALLSCCLSACSSTPDLTVPKEGTTPVCLLSPDELRDRRDQLLPGLIRDAAKVTDLANGLRLEFEHSPELLRRLVQVIEQEQTCCSFLRFQITTEPEHGPIVFDVTGPEGTRELLRKL